MLQFETGFKNDLCPTQKHKNVSDLTVMTELTLLKHFSMCRSATRGASSMPHVTQKMFNSASSSTSAFCTVHAHTQYKLIHPGKLLTFI